MSLYMAIGGIGQIDYDGKLQKRPAVSPELARSILKCSSNMSIKRIAEQCNCTPAEVRSVFWEEKQWRQRLKLDTEYKPMSKETREKLTKWSPEKRQQAIEIGEKEGPTAASRQTGVPVSTVRDWLSLKRRKEKSLTTEKSKEGNNDMGEKNVKIPAPDKEYLEELIIKFNGSINSIAKSEGVSWPVANGWIKEWGLSDLAKTRRNMTIQAADGSSVPLQPEGTSPEAEQLERLNGLRQEVEARDGEGVTPEGDSHTEQDDSYMVSGDSIPPNKGRNPLDLGRTFTIPAEEVESWSDDYPKWGRKKEKGEKDKPYKVVDSDGTHEFYTQDQAMEYIKINHSLKDVLSGNVKAFLEIKIQMEVNVKAKVS